MKLKMIASFTIIALLLGISGHSIQLALADDPWSQMQQRQAQATANAIAMYAIQYPNTMLVNPNLPKYPSPIAVTTNENTNGRNVAQQQAAALANAIALYQLEYPTQINTQNPGYFAMSSSVTDETVHIDRNLGIAMGQAQLAAKILAMYSEFYPTQTLGSTPHYTGLSSTTTNETGANRNSEIAQATANVDAQLATMMQALSGTNYAGLSYTTTNETGHDRNAEIAQGEAASAQQIQAYYTTANTVPWLQNYK